METLIPITEKKKKSEQKLARKGFPPREHLVLQRPMKLFPTALGLQPLVPGRPSHNFIIKLCCGQPSLMAALRSEFGKEFKNFENFAHGKVKTTPQVYQRLLALARDEDVLNYLAKAMRKDAPFAIVYKGIRWLEELFYEVLRGHAKVPQQCPHCQTQLLSDPAQWWQAQTCMLGDAEQRFVDRVLFGVLGITLMPWTLRANGPQMKEAVNRVAGLCSKDEHLFKNWLSLVRIHFHAKDLTSLATRAGMSGPSPDSRLQRTARGEMLTLDTIDMVTSRLPNRQHLVVLGMKARALAFLADFMIAADKRETPMSEVEAQHILGKRLVQLYEDFEVGWGI